MKTYYMSTEKAECIRRKLMALLDNCQIYPRINAHLDSVSPTIVWPDASELSTLWVKNQMSPFSSRSMLP